MKAERKKRGGEWDLVIDPQETEIKAESLIRSILIDDEGIFDNCRVQGWRESMKHILLCFSNKCNGVSNSPSCCSVAVVSLNFILAASR